MSYHHHHHHHQQQQQQQEQQEHRHHQYYLTSYTACIRALDHRYIDSEPLFDRGSVLFQRQVLVYVSFDSYAPRRLQLSATFPSPGTGKELQSQVRNPGWKVEETVTPVLFPFLLLIITRAAMQESHLHIGLLKLGVLSWSPWRAAGASGVDEGGELGGEGSVGTWESMAGCVRVSALRSLFRISEMQGVGVGDVGSVRLGGDEVCTVRIKEKDEGGAGAESEAEEGREDNEDGDALSVAIDLKIRNVQMGAMTQESVRCAIVDELGFQAPS